MGFFDNIPAAPPTFEVATDDGSVLSRWRAPWAPNWTEPAFVAALRAAVKVVRPLARGLSAVLSDGDASRTIGAMLQTEHEIRAAVDTLATDLLASALLLEALGGNPAAQTALDHFRRSRGLPRAAWRKLVKMRRRELHCEETGRTRPGA